LLRSPRSAAATSWREGELAATATEGGVKTSEVNADEEGPAKGEPEAETSAVKEVLDKAVVDPAAIKTWDAFKAACAKVKKLGKIPVQTHGGATASLRARTTQALARSFALLRNRNPSLCRCSYAL